MKMKKEEVLILKNENGKDIKEFVSARTFVYKEHKFNVQGIYKTGYCISDNETGMIIITYFDRLGNVERIFEKIKDNFSKVTTTKEYKQAVERFNKAKIRRKENG